MRDGSGVQLDRAIDSIRVGYRFRGDLGDLDELCTSIQTVGLLQPITITPDGTLVCGRRRLAAVRKLGWDHIKVWVNATISTRLAEVLAEQHENTTRKPLTPTEAAALYAELRQLYAADAARRQQASRFSSEHNPRHHGRDNGGADSAPPSDPEGSDGFGLGAGAGKARRHAARAITGRSSYWSLEHVAEVQRIANDQTFPESVRDLARRELAAMDADGTIHPHYLTVQAAATTDALARLADDPTQPATVRDHAARELTLLDHGQPSAELVKAAQAAIARATNVSSANQADDNSEKSSTDRPRLTPVKQYGLRAFLSTIEEMDGWWQHYDPTEIGAGLTEEQWQRVQANLDGSTAFIEAIATARETAARTEHAHGERAADQPPHAACF